MKKYLILMIALMLLTVPLAFADRNIMTTKGFTTSQLIKRGDAKVYYIDFIATSGGGDFALHDVITSGDGDSSDGSTTIKVEGQEATAKNSQSYNFSNKPLEFSTGLYLYINSGTVVISYE